MGLLIMPDPTQEDTPKKDKLLETRIPMSSLMLSSSIKMWEMVRLPLPMVMVGVFVALAAKVMLVWPPPGIRSLTNRISSVLELVNNGESWKLVSLGLLAT